MSRMLLLSAVVLATASFATVVACGGSDDASVPAGDGGSSGTVTDSGRGPEQTGQACTAASQCYPGLDAGSLVGEVECLDRVPSGYCTHRCEKDEDCCAVPGECGSGLRQVCAPLENSTEKRCFLSCEDEDIAAVAADGGFDESDGAVDDTTYYCHTYASPELNCRSTGGGKNNRKVCLP